MEGNLNYFLKKGYGSFCNLKQSCFMISTYSAEIIDSPGAQNIEISVEYRHPNYFQNLNEDDNMLSIEKSHLLINFELYSADTIRH
jgi:hypothetical protein